MELDTFNREILMPHSLDDTLRSVLERNPRGYLEAFRESDASTGQ
jgi:hypothetical protein